MWPLVFLVVPFDELADALADGFADALADDSGVTWTAHILASGRTQVLETNAARLMGRGRSATTWA